MLKLKSLIKGLSISLLLATTSLTTVQAAADCGIVTTEKDPLNIREGMSLGAKEIAEASKGSALAILSKRAGWYKVMLDDGTVGYGSNDFITPEDQTELRCGKVSTNEDPLNVREGMDTDTKVIAKAHKGAMLRLLGQSSGWYKVKLNNGKIGYVSQEFIFEYTN